MEVDIPSGMIETEVENMLKDFEQRMSYQGIKLDQYLNMLGKTRDEMKKEYEPQAIEGIKSRLALEAVIKAEKIEADDKEIDEKLKEMAKNYGKENDESFIKNENVRNYIKDEYTIYEKIINLCDLMCTTKVLTIDKRGMDLL